MNALMAEISFSVFIMPVRLLVHLGALSFTGFRKSQSSANLFFFFNMINVTVLGKVSSFERWSSKLAFLYLHAREKIQQKIGM